jgi:uncharacterized protein YdaL
VQLPRRPSFPVLAIAVFGSLLGCDEPDEIAEPDPACSAPSQPYVAPGDPVEVLVLHDSSGPWGDLGVGYATMIANLTGHFREARTTIRPVVEYQRGDIEAHDVVFYLGTVYAEPLPGAFHDDFRDFVNTKVIWIGGNLWQLAWSEGQDFESRFGFGYVETGGNSGEGAATTFFQTVRYKGEELPKYFKYHPDSDYVENDPDLGIVEILEPDRVEVMAEIEHSGTGEVVPYVTRSGNFFYVGDNPFTFLGFDDRYWAVTDLMHDFLGIDHAPSMQALFRLEDVHPFVPLAAIDTVRGVLAEAARPWNLAMVPVWADPLGVYNPEGEGREWHYDANDDRAAGWRAAVEDARADGAEIVLHGYTHQLGLTANPFNGVSGTDFEFWDAVNGRPVPGDDWAWAAERVDKASAVLAQQGWTPWSFEVPHYQASMVDYFAIASRYPTVYHQGIYRDFQIGLSGSTYDMTDVLGGVTEGMDLSGAEFRLHSDRMQSQPFPYVIERDIYGQRLIPEDIGNVTPTELVDAGAPDDIRLVQDIIRSARLQRVNRCGFASLFYHPFIVERPDYVDAGGPDNLRLLLEGIEDLGYEFVQACALQPAVPID